MKTHSLNTALISAIAERINYPFIVIDQQGNILSINGEGEVLLNRGSITNLYDLLGNNSGVVIKSLIRDALNDGAAERTTGLVLASGTEMTLKISLRRYTENEKVFIFLTLQKQDLTISREGTADLKLKTSDVKELIKNEEIFSVIEEIKSLYPFTYIGREKVRNLVNRLSEVFWLRDSEGNVVLVNNNMADELGLIPEAIEGKPEISFAPAYLSGFQKMIEEYIKNSLQWVSSRGFPVNGINLNADLLQIPLLDRDSNILAVVGFSQTVDAGAEKEIDYTPVMESLPLPAAILDIEGNIAAVNRHFTGLIMRKPEDLLNNSYNSILPDIISQKISLFLRERDKETSFNFKGIFSGNQDSDYLIHLSDLSVGRKKLFLLIEKISREEDLGATINRRGLMFDLLIQNNPQPVFVYDKDNLRFLEVNDAALKLYGYRKDEFLRMDLTDLYTPEDIQTLLDSSADKTKAAAFTGPYRHKRKDGSSVYVEISKINFKYENKDAHLNIVKDVTEKLQLLNQNQLFKAAFDNTENLLFVTDGTGFITFSNKAVQRILGYSKKDLENTSFTALAANEVRGTINNAFTHATPRDIIVQTLDLKKADGTFQKTDIIATPIVDYKNEISSFTIVGKYEAPSGENAPPREIIREVTKEVIKEVPVEVIREVPVEVIKEVRTERSASGYEDTAGQKENIAFLSSLFHDILTPVNVILGFVQELTQSIKKPSAEQKESVEIINQNRENLLGIMNSIVEYSNIEKDTIDLSISEIAVTEIIDSLQTEIEPVIAPRGIEFAYGRISSSLKFKSDKQRLLNFITVIVKMVSSISREKKIYFSAYNWKENEFYLSIKNNYNVSTSYLVDNFSAMFQENDTLLDKDFGIPKLNIKLARALLKRLKGRFELIEKGDSRDFGFIFPVDYNSIPEVKPPVIEKPAPEPVVKEEPPKKEEPVKQAAVPKTEKPPAAPVKEMDLDELLSEEEIELESELSTLETELAAKPKMPQVEMRKSPQLDLSKLKCLYIEDQVDSQILFKVQLKDLQDIKFAVTFEEALPLLDNNRFDFVLIDINLQGEYNGIDALKIIQNMPGYKNIPLIAVTAYVLPGDRERFIATGFNDFIAKPLFREKLVNSLERIFLMQE